MEFRQDVLEPGLIEFIFLKVLLSFYFLMEVIVS